MITIRPEYEANIMTLSRVTVTVPPGLVRRADGLARQRQASRSAIVAEALEAYLAAASAGAVLPGRGSEPGGEYAALSDDALLLELRQRLGKRAASASIASGAASQGQVAKLRYDPAALTELCRRHHIRRLSLFGSVLRDDFGPESDVDVLVEFEPGHTPGLALADIEDELSILFGGRRVDVVTERSLHRLIRDRVLSSALVQYAA